MKQMDTVQCNALADMNDMARKIDDIMSTWSDEDREAHAWRVTRPMARRFEKVMSERRHPSGPRWHRIHPDKGRLASTLIPHLYGGPMDVGMLLSPVIFRVKTDHVIIE